VASWLEVEVARTCSNPIPDKLMLPYGTATVPSRLVVRAQGKEFLVESGVRSDPGAGACTQGSLLIKLGADEKIEYHKANIWDVLRYRPIIAVQLVVALLSLVSALLTGYLGFVKAQADQANSGTIQLAAVLLVVTFLLAGFKLIVDLRAPFK
jgi:hypothetical protein